MSNLPHAKPSFRRTASYRGRSAQPHGALGQGRQTLVGELDLDGQRRCIDFMIDAGSNGLCILANFSEQFALSDDERNTLMHVVLEHVAGRVPVIVSSPGEHLE